MSHSAISRRRLLKAATAAAALTAIPWRGALAQAYPDRPITLIVPFTPGGATDVQIRALAQAASQTLGQQILINNQPGAGTTLGTANMARAKPDGYTLAVATAAMFRLPHIQKVNFDPLNDFTYITGLTSYVYALAVDAKSPWQTVRDVVEAARKKPQSVSIGATGTGTSGHISTERLARIAGVKFNYVPFKGGADTQVALLGGHVDALFDGGWGAAAEAGRLRLLGVAMDERLPKWPNVPTMKEQGYDFSMTSLFGIAGPRDMDPAVVKRLDAVFREAMKDAAYQRALAVESMPSIYLDPAAYTKYAHDQFESDRHFVQEFGLRPDM